MSNLIKCARYANCICPGWQIFNVHFVMQMCYRLTFYLLCICLNKSILIHRIYFMHLHHYTIFRRCVKNVIYFFVQCGVQCFYPKEMVIITPVLFSKLSDSFIRLMKIHFIPSLKTMGCNFSEYWVAHNPLNSSFPYVFEYICTLTIVTSLTTSAPSPTLFSISPFYSIATALLE